MLPEVKTPASVGDNGKVSKERLLELEAAEKKAKELEAENARLKESAQQTSTSGASESDAEKVKLQNELKALRESQQKARNDAFRVELKEFARKEIGKQNTELFGGKIVAVALEDVQSEVSTKLTEPFLQEHLGDEVWGKKNAENSIKSVIKEALARESKKQEQIQTQAGRDVMVSALAEGVRINSLDRAANEAGELNERTYWSDANAANHDVRSRVFDWMLEAIFQTPMINPKTGRKFYESLRRFGHINELVAMQTNYQMGSGKADGNLLSPNGRMYEAMNNPVARKNLFEMLKRDPYVGKTLREADEVTSASVMAIASYPVDFSKAMIMAVYARNIALEVAATVGTMTQHTATVYDWQYPNSDIDPFQKAKHFFGAVDSDNQATLATTHTATTTGEVYNDEGTLVRASGHFPLDVWGVIGEVVNANTTVTITGTNANGLTTATAVATFLATDPVNTVRRFIPTVVGDKFMDITSVASTGWTDAAGNGEIGIFCVEPLVAHTAGSPANKASFKLVPYTITESEYDVQTNVPLATIEDIESLFAVSGNAGLSLLGRLARELTSYVNDYLDAKTFDVGIANTYANNIDSFAASTPGEGYSDESWKALLRYYLDVLAAKVEGYGGYQPNWMVWHLNDKPEYRQWLSKWMTAFEPQLNDPFTNGRAQFSINNMNVYVTKNTRIERILMGNNNADTGIHFHTRVPLKLLQAPNPAAGFEQVIMAHTRCAIDVLNGRSLGVLQVTRR